MRKAKAKSANPVGAPRKLRDGKRVNVYLDADSLVAAAQLGLGNVSEGIRSALKQLILSR